ncbi:MAG TPA: TssN family type VI secretion system protein [Chryseolinea sp.]
MISRLKNLLDPHVLMAAVVLVILCTLTTMIFATITPAFKKKLKSHFFPYVVILMLVYALLTFLSNNKIFTGLTQMFLFHQVSALCLGVLQVRFYRSYFSEFDEDNIWKEAFFCLLAALYALVPFVVVYTFLNGPQFAFVMATHSIAFLAPTWYYMTFSKAMQIPAKILLTWDFPTTTNAFPEMLDDELRDVVILAFKVSRDNQSTDFLTLRAKAPIRVDFKRVFYHLVMDYNQEHLGQGIEPFNTTEPYRWTFFLKGAWYQQPKFINADFTLSMNGISDNATIVCYRMKIRSLDNFKGQAEAVHEFHKKDHQTEP